MAKMRRPAPDDDDGYERDETEAERLDRNWNEILQELRVLQTGTQILTGFLLTIPFQQRFSELDRFELDSYLTVVGIAVLATILALTPVSLHRALFRRRAKDQVVALAHRFMQLALIAVGLTLIGTALLVFSVVVGNIAGIVAGSITALLILLSWLAIPRRVPIRDPDGE